MSLPEELIFLNLRLLHILIIIYIQILNYENMIALCNLFLTACEVLARFAIENGQPHYTCIMDVLNRFKGTQFLKFT